MQDPAGSRAAGLLAGLRACMETFAFTSCFNFRFAMERVATGNEAGISTRIARHLLRGLATAAPHREAATVCLEALAQGDASLVPFAAVEAMLAEPSNAEHAPVLLFAPAYGHEGGLAGEWLEIGTRGHNGTWSASDERRTFSAPPHPSPLLQHDDALAGINAELYERVTHALRGRGGAASIVDASTKSGLADGGAATLDAILALQAAPPRGAQHGSADAVAAVSIGAHSEVDGAFQRKPSAAEAPQAAAAARETAAPCQAAFAAFVMPPPTRHLLAAEVSNALRHSDAAAGHAHATGCGGRRRAWPPPLPDPGLHGGCALCDAANEFMSDSGRALQDAKAAAAAVVKLRGALDDLKGATHAARVYVAAHHVPRGTEGSDADTTSLRGDDEEALERMVQIDAHEQAASELGALCGRLADARAADALRERLQVCAPLPRALYAARVPAQLHCAYCC